MLLDTSAWIEFFIGSSKGRRVKEVLETNECFTSIVTFAEVTNWALREKSDPNPLIDTIGKLGSIIQLDSDIAILAGRLNFERKKSSRKWGMLDSMILATGMVYGLKLLTKDLDYRNLDDVELL
jgi:predicted nucleic acid-binding protein